MKIYVAGAFKHKAAVGEVQQLLLDTGHTITHDWTSVEGHVTDKDGMVVAKTPYQLRRDAEKDMGGVAAANAVVVVLNDATYAYRGTMAEIGAALALKKPVLVLQTVTEPAIDRVPFLHHRNVTRYRCFNHLAVALVCLEHNRLSLESVAEVASLLAQSTDV